MKQTKKKLFLELAQPDETGMSRKVYPREFKGKYDLLAYRNGNPWARSLQEYIVYIHKEKGRTEYIQLRGYSNSSYKQSIKTSIRKKVLLKPCVVLNTKHNLECDHKDGFKAFDVTPENQEENLFQPMHKSVNDSKREHCKKCRKTRKRFDAKKLGYKKSVFTGTLRYEGTCKGCYWHDPYIFNKTLSYN